MKKKYVTFYFALIFLSGFVIFSPVSQAGSTDYKEADFKKGELNLSALDENQKVMVLRMLNNNDCTCGCSKGTWANCIKTDYRCPYSRPMGVRVVEMVKEGKPEEFILGFFEGWQEGIKNKKSKKHKNDPNKIYPVTPMNAPITGPDNAAVTIIEYTDYQCHFCKRVQPTIKAILNEYKGKVRLATMNNPLSFHKSAISAALAARAAGRQGKFWEMHKLLFENSRKLNDANLLKLAEKLGLDLERFNKDRNDEKLKAEILKEQAQAIKYRATGTPAFFINGKKVSGAKPFSYFKKIIDEALKKSSKK